MDFCIVKQTLNIKQQMYLYNYYVMKNVYTQKVMSIFMYVCINTNTKIKSINFHILQYIYIHNLNKHLH
jgi:hypothetical protein